ncbi:tetratricopeptide repeat protein [Calidithermus timidus]|jgi:tetratricopeptide (TPR) repeat protein|uniref:tetratricopeptide repeat protein n=2 Tax=Bacteria TaxID=2 RepID=UPI0003A9D36B|nr:tetratricopeptide repeat protein [Calidithermus timidus]
MKRWVVLGIGMWMLGVVLAQTPAAVEKMIDEGKLQAAYSEALKLGNAGYVLAAKAASYYAGYQAADKERGSWYDKAEEAAKKAIQADPDNPEAYFELARAHGRLAQFRGILESLNLASSVRDNLNKALKLNPNHAGAKVALALWHLELTQKGVGWLYGANMGQVVPLFEEAIKLEPQTIIHRVEYATALARMNRKAEAVKQLEFALSLPAKTYADQKDQERAKKQLEELK